MLEQPVLAQRSFEQPDWQLVHRLLLATSESGHFQATELERTLHKLRQSLPKVQVGQLVRQGETWRFDLTKPDSSLSSSSLSSSSLSLPHADFLHLIQTIADQCFDAVLIFTQPFQSPYSLAYLSYLAGIPIRVGYSKEFGGSLLSHQVQFSLGYEQLLNAIGL